MLMAYAASLKTLDDGMIVVRFPDVPEAITYVERMSDLQEIGEDALSVALSSYLDADRRIPAPSRPRRGAPVVYLPMLTGAKLAIHDAMVARGWSRTELAARMGCDEKQVRRLLDLDHGSTFKQIETGLRAVGKAASTDVRDLALA